MVKQFVRKKCRLTYAICQNKRMNVQVLVRRIRATMQEQSTSEAALAKLAGVAQSTVNRALRSPVRLTKTHRTICKILGIELLVPVGDPETQEELVQELLDVWDGSREHAHSLARLLRAAATLSGHGASQLSRSR